MEEVWKDIIGYEGYYQVSNLGRIKSLDREVWNRFSYVLRKGRILKENTDKDGYKYVNLKFDDVNKTLKVHRIVAMNFISNPNNLPQINHIDGDKKNNSVSNLEWCSCSDNVRHAYKTGLMNGDLIGVPVAQIDILTNKIINIFPSLQESARSVNSNASNIRKVCIGKNNYAKGFKWRFTTNDMRVGDIID